MFVWQSSIWWGDSTAAVVLFILFKSKIFRKQQKTNIVV